MCHYRQQISRHVCFKEKTTRSCHTPDRLNVIFSFSVSEEVVNGKNEAGDQSCQSGKHNFTEFIKRGVDFCQTRMKNLFTLSSIDLCLIVGGHMKKKKI